ncbi:MAG: GlsB/YeaQ/YmgE family stress response membrane protein [Dehalococcoidia bacterium]|nr:GlsB/YeaQ/YmgE family stress response membrane protein [Dehalococcoidia bacterium]
MNILAWLITGLVAGLIAKALMPGNDPGGIILTILLGIAGALVGGFLSVALGFGNGVDDFDIGTIVLAVLGAMLLLFGYRLLTGSRGAHI